MQGIRKRWERTEEKVGPLSFPVVPGCPFRKPYFHVLVPLLVFRIPCNLVHLPLTRNSGCGCRSEKDVWGKMGLFLIPAQGFISLFKINPIQPHQIERQYSPAYLVCTLWKLLSSTLSFPPSYPNSCQEKGISLHFVNNLLYWRLLTVCQLWLWGWRKIWWKAGMLISFSFLFLHFQMPSAQSAQGRETCHCHGSLLFFHSKWPSSPAT